DASTRNRLVAEQPEVRDLIKPYLRGQDLSRWATADSDLFMILMKSSGDHRWSWHDAPDEDEAERRFNSDYPSLHMLFKPLAEFKDPKTGKLRGLRHREDKGRFWWELRSCAYYEQFEKPTMFYQEIQFHSAYSCDSRSRFSNNKAFMLPTDSPT